jgi:hypothetical protein
MTVVHGTIIRRRGHPSRRSQLHDAGLTDDDIVQAYIDAGRRLEGAVALLRGRTGVSLHICTLSVILRQIESERAAAQGGEQQ